MAEKTENTQNNEEVNSLDSDTDILADSDESSEESDAAESDEESEETDTDEEETEEDKETPTEDDDEEVEEEDEESLKGLKVPFDRPSIATIKAKYPEIFKDFPQLRDSYFREIQYTALFPTVEDAKDAFNDMESFTTLRDSALAGDVTPLLDSVEAADPKALNAFAQGFLPKLYQKNADLYRKVTTPVLENLVRMIHKAGVQHNNEDLTNSALNISKYLFDTDEIATGKKTTVEAPKAEDAEVKNAREAAHAQKLTEAYTSVQTAIQGNMRKIILKDFDPNKVFTPFLRKQLVDTVLDRVMKTLEKDSSHMRVMASRWKRAETNGYTEEDKTKITTAFLARAKSLIPSIREKVRKAALGTETRHSEARHREISDRTETKKEITGGRPTGGSGRNGRFERVDYHKMSDLEILNS